jgi:Sec-independent protein translocase protein TatA
MTSRSPILLLAIISLLLFSPSATAFQAREHLTPQEIVLIQDAQILDKRIDVFIKAADRRMLVLNAGVTDATTTKQLKKDSETWGELPAGSRAELITDIAGIFDEAITNIDDVSSRDEKNPLIPKSLRKLAAAASRIVEQLKPAVSQAKSDAELSSFDQLTENAESILQAANKLPPPTAAEKKGKTKTN